MVTVASSWRKSSSKHKSQYRFVVTMLFMSTVLFICSHLVLNARLGSEEGHDGLLLNQRSWKMEDNKAVMSQLRSAEVIDAIVRATSLDAIKPILPPISSLMTIVWMNREKHSSTEQVLRSWFETTEKMNIATDIRHIFVFTGLEPKSLMEVLHDYSNSLGDRFELVDGRKAQPLSPFASFQLGIDRVKTPYFVGAHADTFIDPASLYFFMRRFILSPDAALVDPILFEIHKGKNILKGHSTYEHLVRIQYKSDDKTVYPRYVHLNRKDVLIPGGWDEAVRSKVQEYYGVEYSTAAGVEYHCAAYETRMFQNSNFKPIDPYATENPLNTMGALAEIQRTIIFDPLAIAAYIYPDEGGKYVDQQDIFYLSWAWSVESAYINNCYIATKFEGMIPEMNRWKFWIIMLGERAAGIEFGWGSSSIILEDENHHLQLLLAFTMLVGANRVRLRKDGKISHWMEPRSFYHKLDDDKEFSSAVAANKATLEFATLPSLDLPKWEETQKLSRWKERASLDFENESGWLLADWYIKNSFTVNCEKQHYRSYHLLKIETTVKSADDLHKNKPHPCFTKFFSDATLVLQTEQRNLEYWFDFPTVEKRKEFVDKIEEFSSDPTYQEMCNVKEVVSDPPSSIRIPNLKDSRLLHWSHNIDYGKYREEVEERVRVVLSS